MKLRIVAVAAMLGLMATSFAYAASVKLVADDMSASGGSAMSGTTDNSANIGAAGGPIMGGSNSGAGAGAGNAASGDGGSSSGSTGSSSSSDSSNNNDDMSADTATGDDDY